MAKKNRPRNSFPGNPAKLPPPAEVWRLRQSGVPVFEISRRYKVTQQAVYSSLAKYRIRNGLRSPSVLTLKRFLEGLGG